MTAEAEIKHMHGDIKILKRDIAVIKHILFEEGKLTDDARKRLEKARKTPISEYLEL